ncbi:hypothetical protein sscle_09g070480 [Sclerotinia sclerotiorum 1980 UF-70]|uniref:Uncharacterized protein n=1 Tax=Sclerotinia sclerotiorum (strain ATCC 18683 / 1980 / Ss-1) TaxID=665079 RepID=A0A1D9QBJ0_SCLS1|nr:hypothetical protein sscle_09g070480 [Sclerotinia sclerotiorum 1980 UF-70]
MEVHIFGLVEIFYAHRRDTGSEPLTEDNSCSSLAAAAIIACTAGIAPAAPAVPVVAAPAPATPSPDLQIVREIFNIDDDDDDCDDDASSSSLPPPQHILRLYFKALAP